jgi:hypothetical protein
VKENVKSFEIFGNIQFLKMEPSKLINHFLGHGMKLPLSYGMGLLINEI